MSVFLLTTVLATQGAITLQYQPKVGSTYKFSMSQSMTSSMGKGGMTFTMTQKVLSSSTAGYKIQLTTSDFKGEGMMGQGQMKGSTTTTTINKYGAIADGGGSQAMSQMMSGMGAQGVGFPKKPVKIGDTWTTTLDMGQMMNAAMKGQKGAGGSNSTGKINLTYKLIKFDGSKATVGVTASGGFKMSGLPGGGKTNGGQGATMTMNMTLNGSGFYTIERATGMTYDSSVKMNTSMSIGKQPITTSQTITMKRI